MYGFEVSVKRLIPMLVRIDPLSFEASDQISSGGLTFSFGSLRRIDC